MPPRHIRVLSRRSAARFPFRPEVPDRVTGDGQQVGHVAPSPRPPSRALSPRPPVPTGPRTYQAGRPTSARSPGVEVDLKGLPPGRVRLQASPGGGQYLSGDLAAVPTQADGRPRFRDAQRRGTRRCLRPRRQRRPCLSGRPDRASSRASARCQPRRLVLVTPRQRLRRPAHFVDGGHRDGRGVRDDAGPGDQPVQVAGRQETEHACLVRPVHATERLVQP